MNTRIAMVVGLLSLVGAHTFAQNVGTAATSKVREASGTTASNPWDVEPLATPSASQVITLRDTLTDVARDKQLQVIVRFPLIGKGAIAAENQAAAPSLPLVVFSHGMGGDREAFAKLSEHWASHNFIVVHVTHSDSIKLRREQGEKLTMASMRDVRNVDPADRLADVVYLASNPTEIDSLIATAAREQSGAVAPTINPQQVTIAGHSAGALTTALAVNVKARMRTEGTRVRDMLALNEYGSDIFKAGIIISGQGTTNRMFTNESWNALRVPIMVLAGSKDVAQVGKETPESRRHPFEKSRGQAAGGPPAYLLWIEGATHGSYQGKDLTKLLREETDVDVDMVAAATRASTLAFLLCVRDNTLGAPQVIAPQSPAAMQAAANERTLAERAARVLKDGSWMPAMTEQQATLTSK